MEPLDGFASNDIFSTADPTVSGRRDADTTHRLTFLNHPVFVFLVLAPELISFLPSPKTVVLESGRVCPNSPNSPATGNSSLVI